MDTDKSQYEKLGAATNASAEILFLLGRMDARLENMQRKLDKLVQAEKESRGYPPEQYAPPHLNKQ